MKTELKNAKVERTKLFRMKMSFILIFVQCFYIISNIIKICLGKWTYSAVSDFRRF